MRIIAFIIIEYGRFLEPCLGSNLINHFTDFQDVKNAGHDAKVTYIIRLDIQIHAIPFEKAISAIYLKIFRIFKKLKLRNRESKVRNVGLILFSGKST